MVIYLKEVPGGYESYIKTLDELYEKNHVFGGYYLGDHHFHIIYHVIIGWLFLNLLEK